MRGGTSKALVFLQQDLPQNRNEWDALFLAAMGSPDDYGRQLDGMGGGVSSLSKICVVAPSQRSDADVDYTFGQVLIDEARVDYKGNCGNISSAVGPFAVDKGLVQVQGAEGKVRIYNTNTNKVIHAIFPVKEGQVQYEGELEIPGVSATGAPIQLQFLDPGGATTGRLLPTGLLKQNLEVPGYGSFEVSMVDAANACVFVKATELGLKGTELPQDIEATEGLMEKLEALRRRASLEMGISKNLEEAANTITVPYIAIVSYSASFVGIDGEKVEAQNQDLCVRVIASGQPHKALPLTVSLCTAVAAKIRGSIVNEVAQVAPEASPALRLGMPSGVLTVGATVTHENGEWRALSGDFYRTARPLFEGRVWVK